MTNSKPVRATKRATAPIAELRTRAKELGINSFGLSGEALSASISAVEGALAKAPEPNQAPQVDFVEDDGPRADDTGEALGPRAIERVPMGTRQRRLAAPPPRPGYYQRFINDVPGRVDRAKRAGYEHRRDAQGNPMLFPAGTHEKGGGMDAYLMEIPQKLRDEDLLTRKRANDEIDQALNRGTLNSQADDKRYVPASGISITHR